MDHDGARRLMAEAVEGKLAPPDERELALHLVGCAECKHLYDGLQHAHPALAAIGVGSPPTRAVDTAVRRATTVLRGEADPGPLGRPAATEPARPAGEPPESASAEPQAALSWAQSTGPLLPADVPERPASAQPPAPPAAPPPPRAPETQPPAPAAPTPSAPQAPARDEPARDEPDRERPAAAQPPPKPAEPPARSEAPGPKLEPWTAPATPGPRIEEPPARSDRPSPPEPAAPPQAPAPARPLAVPPAPSPGAGRQPTRISSSPLEPRVSRVDEVEELLDEDYTLPPGPGPLHEEPRRAGAGPWLAAIAVTIALAVLAAVLITRGQGIFGAGSDLPQASEVQGRLTRLFADLKSLKTSFSVRKLSLYRVGGAGDSLTYTFANGTYSGRLVYDRAEGYRQEVTLTVGQNEVDRAKMVQTANETRSLLGDADVILETRPPLGPPDGSLRPHMGLLEESVGAAVRALATADGLEVVGRTSQNGRDLYEVRASVTPNELTRADRIDAFLDSQTFFPAIIRRSIARVDAGVLGPPDVLTDDAIATAFGERDRITSELVELDSTVIDDIILPGEYVLDEPEGSEPQTRDRGFERITSAQAAGRLPYAPLFPRTLPDGFAEQLVAITAEKVGWGPGGAYPAPDGVMHATYFDGKTTIAVTQKNLPSGPFNLDGSPLQSGGLPISVRPIERDEKRFFYGVSPEVPPHAYGFLGNVFVMASGYVPAEDLVAVLAALEQVPDASAGAEAASPSPGASPAAGGQLPSEDVP